MPYKNSICSIGIFVLLIGCFPLASREKVLEDDNNSLLLLNRSVCPACPKDTQTFCTLCVDEVAYIRNLVVQESLLFCSGVSGVAGPTGATGIQGFPGITGATGLVGPTGLTGISLAACYNDSLIWGPWEMSRQQSVAVPTPVIPTPFRPYTNVPITLDGWAICRPLSPNCLGDGETEETYVTVQFEIPLDLDTAVEPTLHMHFFVVGISEAVGCARFEVQADFLANTEAIAIGTLMPPYIIETPDIAVPSGPVDSLIHFEVPVLLEDILTESDFLPGNYAQITVKRIPQQTCGGPFPEYSAPIFLTVLSMEYRKAQCPSLI